MKTMPNISASNKRIAHNTIFLYVRMVFVLIVSLYTSRVVLNVLGVSDYGVYNVVAGFVSLFSFLNATLSSSLQRFYNYEGGKKSELGLSNVFSVGVRVHTILAIIIFIVLETFGIWYINNVMVLPEGRVAAARFLYQFAVASMLLVVMQIPFTAAIIANEKMDFYAIVSIVDVLLRLIIVLILPHVSSDRLIVYGFLLFCITCIDFLLYVVYSKLKFNYLKFEKDIDLVLLKNLISFSGWNLLGTFVFMLKGQGANLLLNSFFGTTVNAARGVAFQVNGAITGFSSNISMSFRPQMVSSFAECNFQRTYNLFKVQSKICYNLLLMIIVPVVFEIDLLLQLWLGSATPQDTSIFTILVLFDALVCSLNAPVTQVVYATGNIKKYQILTSIVNIFLLPISWLFLRLGYDAWIVFLITIIISIINQIVAIVSMREVFSFNMREYLKDIVLPCIVMTVLVPLFPLLISYFLEDSILRLVLVSIVSIMMTFVLLYYFFMSNYERELAKQFIKKLFRLGRR